MANVFNDAVDIGADWYLDITWLNEDQTPRDLTGYTFEFNVAASYSIPAIIELSLGNGILCNAPLTGKISIHISNNQSSLANAANYVYDAWAISASGIKTRLLQGNLKFTSKVAT